MCFFKTPSPSLPPPPQKADAGLIADTKRRGVAGRRGFESTFFNLGGQQGVPDFGGSVTRLGGTV